MKFDQVIVVEGKTDTQKLKKIYGPEIDTIETNGLNVNAQLLNLLEDVNKNRGIIILTDPDGPGQKIREQINTGIKKDVLNAFISRPLVKTRAKIGVAEASDEEIQKALKDLMLFKVDNNVKISWQEYLQNDWYLPENRQLIAKKFNWSLKISSKTLFKWINWTGLTPTAIKKIVDENKE